MNGAAMDYQQEEAPHAQNKSSSLVNRLQSSSSYRQRISHPHDSKAMNDPSDSYVDIELWKSQEPYASEFLNRQRLSNPEYVSHILESRYKPRSPTREPMELPVPQFEVDENYVGEIPKTNSVIQNSKDLDLDTRINLLIKSKALSGMHPIFCELSESEDFSHSSDDSLTDFPSKSKHKLSSRMSPSPEPVLPLHDSFDDPETPLSRPPSPFLSRATYLYWFNKAIELKQQAKAQEKALIEIATKKLLKSNTAGKTSTGNDNIGKKDPSSVLSSLLDEVGKEVMEAIKQECLNQIIESTAFNSLENWWEIQENIVQELSVVSSTTDESSELLNKTEDLGAESVANDVSYQSESPTSPKEPFPWKKANQESEKMMIDRSQVLEEDKGITNSDVQNSQFELSELSETVKSTSLTENDSVLKISLEKIPNKEVQKQTESLVHTEEHLHSEQESFVIKSPDQDEIHHAKEEINESICSSNEPALMSVKESFPNVDLSPCKTSTESSVDKSKCSDGIEISSPKSPKDKFEEVSSSSSPVVGQPGEQDTRDSSFQGSSTNQEYVTELKEKDSETCEDVT